ncbi:hypothetical protein F5Y07DRAFT_406915 [Xylaria sp. FL0933]|nr:hypothetical protein F5Y07DRAFT_406915 [Xylaria sp. FL0933]
MAPSQATPAKAKTTLVVGIDFGTTFSGVSWLICKTGSPATQPEVISLWPTSIDNRRGNSDSQKVPTKVHYTTNGELSWGFRTPTGIETVEWFKLLLLNDEDLQIHLRGSPHLYDAQRVMPRIQKNAVQLTADYLKALWDHTLEQICNAKGQTVVDGIPFNVVLTVPAIWPDYARGRMREAATLAGILKDRGIPGIEKTTLSFISEPEAAAIATMPELETREDLQVGDSFIVLDAGGGTVDIISYKINKLEPLLVSECVEGEGALCGGTFLDKEFESFLKGAVGEVPWNKMNGSDRRRMMNNEWEHGIKVAFDGAPDYYTVELPSRTLHPPLQLSSDELRPIFDKIVSQTVALAQKQISTIKEKTSRLPKLLILVGGFGRSPYILKHLKEKLHNEITLLQARGDKPWTAICRGATLSLAAELCSTREEPLLQSRIARLNYGWDCHMPFKNGVHDPRDKFWHNTLREWRAQNQMEWVIRRGDDISLKEAKTYEYFRQWPVDQQGYVTVSEVVCTCEDLKPPSRKEDHVRDVATITFRTPKPVERYERVYTDDFHSYRCWSYKWKVVVSGASFDMYLISDGKEEKMEKILIEVK